MTAILLSPHNDDETLFAGFSVLRHRPHVVTCLTSWTQAGRGGPDRERREEETKRALYHLQAPSWQQLPVRDDSPDWEMLAALLKQIDSEQHYDLVIAPAFENGGHEQHNMVAALAEETFGSLRLLRYHTYVRGAGKTRSPTEVTFDHEMAARKLHAMAEYDSQIEEESTRFWFCDETLREWYA